jgi:Zn-dependent protease with chaperone function
MNFFRSQDAARSSTTRLVVLFALAVLSLVILTNLLLMFMFGFFEPERYNSMTALQAWQQAFDWRQFAMTGAGVIAIVVLGSLYKILALAGGGARVAEMLGGELLVNAEGDLNRQKLLNIVAEMAIASGTPVPPVYLLDENGINAFAAGYKPGDAVIGVTRGAIEMLNREQLQGVIAHEFSHILNGDMRLNIRLIGILHGILLIGLIGHQILRGGMYSRRSKNNGGIALVGLGLMVIGYAGTFFGNLIKAAVSRQREFLADASAVQFTRNPGGIAGALKRIGGYTDGSVLQNPNTEQISHAFFSQAISTWFGGLFATHPPLATRIRRIEPQWDGKFDSSAPGPASGDETGAYRPSATEKTAATMATIAAAMTGGAVIDNVGQPSAENLGFARRLLRELPTVFSDAIGNPFAARAVIYYLLLDSSSEVRGRQLEHLRSTADKGIYIETMKLAAASAAIRPEYRLPLADLTLPGLRQLSPPQYQLFRDNLDTLIGMDGRVSLFEWSMRKIVLHHLDPVFAETRRAREHLTLKQSVADSALLLSLLVYAGKPSENDAEQIFAHAREQPGLERIELLPKNAIGLDALDNALDRLARLKPLQKPGLLKACAAIIGADSRITATEVELLRAISATLDCPMPPLLV